MELDKGVKMKSTDVTIIAAPFGFGPTGKALAISRELIRRGYSVKILGDKNSIKLANDAGILAGEYQYRTELNLADLHSKVVVSYLDISTKIINPSNTPLVFADSLFWIRGWFERGYDYPADITLSQMFFKKPLKSEIKKTKQFHEVEAILSPGFLTELPQKSKRLIFYPGGLRSPYLGERYGIAYYNWCKRVIISAAKKANWHTSDLLFILPPQLNKKVILNDLEKNNIKYLINCANTAEYFMESTHSFISPGIETTLESLASGINPLFTPIFNGSHVPQIIADRKAHIGQELSTTFNAGIKKFESGTNHLSGLSMEVEKYTMKMLDNPDIFNEAIKSATRYLKKDQPAKNRFPLGKNGATEICDHLEQYLNKEVVKSAYYRVSVKAKIEQDGKILLVKEDGKDWDLPGGGIEHNESIAEALKRELKEEIGLSHFTITSKPILCKMIDKTANRPLLFIIYNISINESIQPKSAGNIESRFFSKNRLPKTVSYSEEYDKVITL